MAGFFKRVHSIVCALYRNKTEPKKEKKLMLLVSLHFFHVVTRKLI